MIDQLVVGNVASYDKFEANVKERSISAPKKKSIKQTVPFSNVTYDFSKINGELYWEERDLTYVFELVASSAEELEEKKKPFVSWVMNIFEEDIFDPYIVGYHFVGTFADIDFADDVEKSTITVYFTAYPYMIANAESVWEETLAANAEKIMTIQNNSSHRIVPTIVTTGEIVIQKGNVSYSIPAGTVKDDTVMLEPDENVLTIKNISGAACEVTVKFYEEVF